MTFFRRTLIAAATVATLAAPFAVLSQDIKPRIIRFGYGLNESSNQGRAAKVFADAVEKTSGGKMKVRAIAAAALGPDTQMQQALIGGAQEMMVGSTATLVGITKEMALWDTPFLFSNAKEADALLDGPLGQQQAACQQDGRPGRHQAAGNAKQRVFEQLQHAGCQRRTHVVFRTLWRAGNQNR